MGEADENEKSDRPPAPNESGFVETKVAWIALFAAILGALINGLVSYHASERASQAQIESQRIAADTQKEIEKLTAAGKSRELDIKFVEIGIAILRADPKDQNTAKIRDWAIDIVDHFAPPELKFTEDQKAQLRENAVKAKGSITDRYYGDGVSYGGYDSTYGGAAPHKANRR